jgi:predicted GIY-YIG superfamily endonuclease
VKAPYTVYILHCRDGSLYTGIAKDVEARLVQHRAKKGSKYVAARLPVTVIYNEKHPTKSSAMKREWAIKQLRQTPSVYLDTSGSVVDEGMVEMAARELGIGRLLFGTDMTMEGGVGKILGADLTEAQRERVFWKNMKAILDRRNAH